MMSPQNISEESQINEKVFRLVSYGLAALMMVCLALTMGSLVIRLIPTWQSWGIAILSFFISLERLYTHKQFRYYPFLNLERFLSFLTRWTIVLILVKLVVGLSHGLAYFLEQIPLWQKEFLGAFIDAELVIGMFIVAASWMLSGSFAALLNEMSIRQPMLEASPDGQIKPIRIQLLDLILISCAFLVFVTSLTRIDLRAMLTESKLIILNLPPLAGGGTSTLFYFMFGLTLLSQTHFVNLHTHWSLENIPVSGNLSRDWAIYSIAFLLGLILIVSLLPTNYSLGLLGVLGAILDAIFKIIFYIAQGIMLVMVMIIGLTLQLLTSGQAQQESMPQTVTPPVITNPTEFVFPPWWPLVKSVFFWFSFTVLVIFAVAWYIKQHQEILEALRKLPVWQAALKFWAWLRNTSARVRDGLSKTVQDSRKRLRAQLSNAQYTLRSRLLNFRELTPRRKVFFFYLALIRRSEETGLERRSSQTPYEYAATLDKAFPVVGEDIDSLTEAFIDARYSRREIGSEDVSLVKRYWNKIRQALHRKP
ncbi:MAG: DUF4129 domain-containing protein [Anaerolineales bacterium]|nr:DUF4129 domain-containing protein [Anaerolineales bacterium]